MGWSMMWCWSMVHRGSVMSRSRMGRCYMVSCWCMVYSFCIYWVLKIKWKCVPMSMHVMAMRVSIFMPIFMISNMFMIMIKIMVKVFMPILFKLVLWHLVGEELLLCMVLYSVLCSCFDVVE